MHSTLTNVPVVFYFYLLVDALMLIVPNRRFAKTLGGLARRFR